ncbi:MAG TPA: helix-turn-helix domain-containing protein [Acidobacteria bacterium]|jgi:molybdopterin-binding protein|nr:helix-turn-helix domain-containing protein [Acidobacteriota bacterium]HIN70785.1 helix-turn-helix domain-containing protein [Acidobacteriota bacterium]
MLLTVRQAAGRLGVSYSTLKQWIFKGSVRTTRTEGGHHRVAEVEVERLLAKQGHLPTSKKNSAIGSGTLVAVSGRNQLRGIVDEIRLEGLLAQVQLRVGDQVLTAIITRDAVSALKLRRGSAATALIKSTEVMIAREAEPPPLRQQRAKA